MNKQSLDRHIEKHLAIKPHPCKLCGKAFELKSQLKTHLLHHKGMYKKFI